MSDFAHWHRLQMHKADLAIQRAAIAQAKVRDLLQAHKTTQILKTATKQILKFAGQKRTV